MKLLVQPEGDSYSLSFGVEALRVELDGGLGRYRADIVGASKRIRPRFSLDPTEYEYFMAFYRQQAQRGAEPFEMDLLIDRATYALCTVHMIPGSLQLSDQSGLSYVVSVELEVETPYNPTEVADDTDIIDAYNLAQGYTP